MPPQDSILVVEDNTAARDRLALLLGREGYWVSVVNDGVEALNYLKNYPVPRVILLDLMMPLLDGWQFLKQLNDLNLQPKPCVIVITGAGDIGRDEAAGLGCD